MLSSLFIISKCKFFYAIGLWQIANTDTYCYLVVIMTLGINVVLIVGDVTCLATIPFDMEVEAYFLAKEDGIIAGIALAEMIFHEVDPSLKV